MTKKIAVVISNRQDEALRMSIGLTLVDDSVDIFFVDKKIQKHKNNKLNIETTKDLDIKMYSNCEEDDDLTYLLPGELAKKLLTYDHILPY